MVASRGYSCSEISCNWFHIVGTADRIKAFSLGNIKLSSNQGNNIRNTELEVIFSLHTTTLSWLHASVNDKLEWMCMEVRCVAKCFVEASCFHHQSRRTSQAEIQHVIYWEGRHKDRGGRMLEIQPTSKWQHHLKLDHHSPLNYHKWLNQYYRFTVKKCIST